MLRKMVFLMGLLLMPLVVQAQARSSQSPIIALNKNTLYAVSPIDGSAQVIVQPAEGEVLLPRLSAGAVSSDGKWLVYGIVKQVDTPNSNVTRLFLLNLVDYSSQPLVVSGGVFDRPVSTDHLFQLYMPTWSYDGSRVYYIRTEIDTKGDGTNVDRQLVYYTIADDSYHLAGRLDPNTQIEGLTAIKAGMILRTHITGEETTTFTLYTPDNAVTRQLHEQSLAPDVVNYEGRFYYTVQDTNRQIKTLIDVETNDTIEMAEVVYAGIRSRAAGEVSIGIYQLRGVTGMYFSVYGDEHIASIDNPHGFRYAVAPDGQALAFIQYDDSAIVGKIQIIDMLGQIRELSFEATQLLWGAHDVEVVDPIARG